VSVKLSVKRAVDRTRCESRLIGVCIFLLVTLLSSCCAPGVKPEDANVFQAACGLYSGNYEARKKSRQKDVEKSRGELARQQSESKRLTAELSRARQEEAILRKKMEQLSANNKLLETQISNLRETTAAEKRQKEKRQEELNRINRELEIVKMRFGWEQDSVEDVANEVERLEKEVDTLRSIILSQ